MKTLSYFLFFSLVLSFGLVMSCGNKAQALDKTGKEYTSAYICPMHCDGSGSEQSGKCPTCKMDYVRNEKVKNTEATPNQKAGEQPAHNHDHGHEGHNHDHDHSHDHNHDHGHEGHNH